MESLDRLFTVEDLADYLDVPIATIYAWRYRRQGPAGFRVGRYVRFRRGDVEQWIAAQLAESTWATRRAPLQSQVRNSRRRS